MSPEINGPIINPVSEMWRSTIEKPLTIDRVRLVFPQMRKDLLRADLILTPTPEIISSLATATFPNSREGRGPGVVATLGENKATALIGFCNKRCINCRETDEGNENSRGRGLKQVAADIVELAINENPTDAQIDKLVLRTNRRIKKYSEIRSKITPDAVKNAYHDIPKLTPDKKWREFKSIPYDSLPDLWDFLVTK